MQNRTGPVAEPRFIRPLRYIRFISPIGVRCVVSMLPALYSSLACTSIKNTP